MQCRFVIRNHLLTDHPDPLPLCLSASQWFRSFSLQSSSSFPPSILLMHKRSKAILPKRPNSLSVQPASRPPTYCFTIQAFEHVGMIQSVSLAWYVGIHEMISLPPRALLRPLPVALSLSSLIPFLLILLFHYSLMRHQRGLRVGGPQW